MAPSTPRLRILSVGGNAVSAFLSWRLQATNACDVTLVWKNGYQGVAQYGISFKSTRFGNERFKPRHVVQSTNEAATREAAFDYVLLCVKPLPDLYDLAAIIESVVTPQHTCIIVNTTNTLGIESQLEERFPSNVVLSLVSGADLVQLGASEFEHTGNTDVWVGPANLSSSVPSSISKDMSDALSMTLSTGQVDCRVSPNIRKQQFERMIGQIALQPASVLFETSSVPELLELVGVRQLISDIMDEILQVAASQKCVFASDFKETTMQNMLTLSPDANTMFQDYVARRPLEIETYLGAPIEFAKTAEIAVPRMQTIYAVLHNLNTKIKAGQIPPSPVLGQHPPRITSSQPPARPIMNGQQMNGPPMNGPPMSGPPTNGQPMNGPPMNGQYMNGPPMMNGQGRGGRVPSSIGMPMPPSGRRGPPPPNGFHGPPRNGYPSRQMQRKPSFEDGSNLDEFSHVVLYDDIPGGDVQAHYGDMPPGGAPPPNIDIREREYMLRQRELQMKEYEMSMRRGPPPGGRRTSQARGRDFIEDDDDDEYVDPNGHGPPQVDTDNFDMMSVTSRRTRKAPSQAQLRKNVFEGGGGNSRSGGGFSRFHMSRNRTSARMMNDATAGLHDNLMDNPMMSYASNRYGAVDRKELHTESRAGSLTASRMQEFGQGPYPVPPNRRTSQSPGNPFGGMDRRNGRPSPPQDGYSPRNGMPNGMPSGMPNGISNGMPHGMPNGLPNGIPNGTGRPSPPGGMRAPMPRHPPGHGNAVHPQQVEHQAGVSKPFPPPKGPGKSLTGSASASAGSGDSGGSANVDSSEPSAHSSQSSFAPRYAVTAR